MRMDETRRVQAPAQTQSRAQPRLQRRRPGSARRRGAGVALTLVVVLLAPGLSYAQALTYPGSATWQMRSVEWMRDHGGSPLVDRVENWYYTTNRPTGSAPASFALPHTAGADAASRSPLASPAPAPLLAGHSPILGEGTWVPGRLDPGGAPAIYTSFFRPDPQYPSVVAGVAWIRARSTIAHLVGGTREPGGHLWPGGAQVAQGDIPKLVANLGSPVLRVMDHRNEVVMDQPPRKPDHATLQDVLAPPTGSPLRRHTKHQMDATPRRLVTPGIASPTRNALPHPFNDPCSYLG